MSVAPKMRKHLSRKTQSSVALLLQSGTMMTRQLYYEYQRFFTRRACYCTVDDDFCYSDEEQKEEGSCRFINGCVMKRRAKKMTLTEE